MSLSEEAITLQRAAHELMYLGMDGSPVYSDDLSRRNGEVYRLTMALYRSGVKGTTIDEQANVCLALLMGYSASFVDHGEKQRHVQKVLDCCWDVLDALPASLLKLRLLTACYGEVFDESLADEARAIHDGDAPQRGIYGEATVAETKALQEDGVAVTAIPWTPLEH